MVTGDADDEDDDGDGDTDHADDDADDGDGDYEDDDDDDVIHHHNWWGRSVRVGVVEGDDQKKLKKLFSQKFDFCRGGGLRTIGGPKQGRTSR